MSRMEITEDRVSMWAVLSPVTSEILHEEGILFSKYKFVVQKYGETSWSFMEAYRFLADHMSDSIVKPGEAESPIWLYGESKWAVPFEDGIVYKVSVPKDELFVFDRRLWAKVLNMEYLGDEKGIERYREELLKNGIRNSDDVIRTPFYPVLKRKLMKSWEILFDRIPETAGDIQGAVWFLKREWIVETDRIVQQTAPGR